MRSFLLFASLVGLVLSDEACYNHVTERCDSPGEDWNNGGCSSIHGGFPGNSNNLHRIVVDDFTDSMHYLLMASTFNTDVRNKMGFHKFFMEKSDSMWGKGKDMIKYILQRGGKMSNGFQIPPIGASQSLSSLDYSNEMKGLGVTLDLLKNRAEDALIASLHAYRKGDGGKDSSFDPTTAHLLEEVHEDYSKEIRDVAEKLNILGRMVKKANSQSMALHLFDNMLKG